MNLQPPAAPRRAPRMGRLLSGRREGSCRIAGDAVAPQRSSPPFRHRVLARSPGNWASRHRVPFARRRRSQMPTGRSERIRQRARHRIDKTEDSGVHRCSASVGSNTAVTHDRLRKTSHGAHLRSVSPYAIRSASCSSLASAHRVPGGPAGRAEARWRAMVSDALFEMEAQLIVNLLLRAGSADGRNDRRRAIPVILFLPAHRGSRP